MSGGGGSTSTTTQKLSPEQQQILGLVTPVFESYFPKNAQGEGTGAVNASVYPGAGVVPPNQLQSLGQQMVLGATGGANQSAQQALGGVNFLASGDVLDIMRNPGLQGAINAGIRPITENFQQSILPQIRDESVFAGGYGDNRQGIAEGMASQAYLRQVGDTASTMASNAYNQGLEAMGRGLALAPGIQQAAYGPGIAVSGVGAQQQAFEQAQLQDTISRFYQEQFLPLMIAQQIAGTALGFPGGTTITTQEGGETSPMQMAAGGASFLTSLLPLFFL